MAILSKACKSDNFESHNSLKLSFTNIRGLRSNFANFESFLESNSPGILALCERDLDGLMDFQKFFCERLSSFNPNGFQYSYAWSHSLCEGRTFFCTEFISRKLCRFLLMFFTSFTSFSVLLLFPLFCICAWLLILFDLTLMRFS